MQDRHDHPEGEDQGQEPEGKGRIEGVDRTETPEGNADKDGSEEDGGEAIEGRTVGHQRGGGRSYQSRQNHQEDSHLIGRELGPEQHVPDPPGQSDDDGTREGRFPGFQGFVLKSFCPISEIDPQESG